MAKCGCGLLKKESLSMKGVSYHSVVPVYVCVEGAC